MHIPTRSLEISLSSRASKLLVHPLNIAPQAAFASRQSRLDIQNVCFSLLSQLVEKMCPSSPFPSEIAQTLQELAISRDECAAKLGLTKAESKQLLLEVFNGSHLLPPWDTHDLLKMVQRTSIYCRWLACTTLQEVYAKCSREPSRRHPDASALFSLWSAAEDFVLQAWVDYLTTLRPRHLSLHYDGVRIFNLAVHGGFIAESQTTSGEDRL